MHPVAARRILRLAFGTAIALWFSQAVAWDLSFVMPVLVSVLLSIPIPAPRLKQGLGFILALALPVYAALLLLPFLYDYRAVGILLLIAACFWSFYYSAKGGSPVLGAFLTMGLAVLTAVGSDSIDAAIMVNKAIVINAIIAIMFVWLAHAFFPDLPLPRNSAPRPAPPAPSRRLAIWSAWRSTVIVFPVMLFFLFYPGSASYLVVMIKVASMGQQVENDNSRAVGKSLLLSTIYGGIGAIIMWRVMSVWPSLIIYTLLIALGGLVMGRRVFQGLAMHPQAGTWSYAFLTMIVIIAPAVMDSAGGGAAGAQFWDRLIMLLAATFYSVAAVTVYDAFRPKERIIAASQSSA
ncbi:MAG: DUF2955 domain-containing protein [Woeseiaceae bacterium]